MAVMKILALACLGVAAVSGQTTEGPTAAPTGAPTSAPTAAPASATVVVVPLSGLTETVNPQDKSGFRGEADLTLVQPDQICFSITHNLEGVQAGHIHAAPPGQDGPVVVDLLSAVEDQDFTANPLEGCATAPPEVMATAGTGVHYVNLHTAVWPEGAIRGNF